LRELKLFVAILKITVIVLIVDNKEQSQDFMRQARLAFSHYGNMVLNAMTAQANPMSTGTKVSFAPKGATMRITPNSKIDYIIDLAIIGIIIWTWLWLASS
jgi:hypothetical protein